MKKILFLTALLSPLFMTAEINLLEFYSNDGKCGRVDYSGTIVVPAKYDDIYTFSEGLAAVRVNDKWGFIDKNGNMIIPAKYDTAMSFSDGMALVGKKEGSGYKFGFINKKGDVAVPILYQAANSFSNGLAPVCLINGKWILVDKEGKRYTPDSYEFINKPSEGLAAVVINRKYGFIDNHNQIVIPAIYDQAGVFSEGLVCIGINTQGISGKWGYIDKAGTLVIPAEYNKVSNFSEGLAAVMTNHKWGFIDKNNNMVIPAKYDYAWEFTRGLARVKENGKWGFIDKTGEYVIPARYESARDFSNGFARVKENGEYTFIDKTGNKYDSYSAIFDAVSHIRNVSFPEYINEKLGSWNSFVAQHNLNLPSDKQIIEQIKKEIEEWQRKGEFETTAQWRERVTETTRAEKARQIANRINNIYYTQTNQLRTDYQKRYNALSQMYCDLKSINFASQTFTLKPYDADNQTFLISTEMAGDILLPVTIDKAQEFKANWNNIVADVSATYVPSGDYVALQSVRFGDYVYDSNTKADYTVLDIDYNFRPIDVSNMVSDMSPLADNSAPTVNNEQVNTLPQLKIEPDVRKITGGTQSDIDRNIPRNNERQESTFAVIIANSNYAHASNVVNAENDGRTVEQYFNHTLGIPASNITTYINATYGQMASAVGHLKNIADAYGKDNFNVVFYYVGHGLPDDSNRESFMLPVDVDPKNTDICYSLTKLYNQLGSLGAASVTVIIDACFSGANYGDGMLLSQAMGVKLVPKASTPTGNMIVLSATQGNETAYPYSEKGHGLFTYWLLKKLQESNGNVSLGDLADYVKEHVGKTSVVVNRKPQTPAIAVSPALNNNWRHRRFGK